MEESRTLAWTRMLAPWIQVLGRVRLDHVMTMPHTTTGPRECWWSFDTLLPPPRRFSTEMWTLVREAMELLDLLSRVEPPLARYMLTSATGVSDPEVEKQPPRFQIKIVNEWDSLRRSSRQGILHLVTHDGRAPSETYESVKAALLAQWASSHGGRALDRDTEGRVELALEFTTSLKEEDQDPGLLRALRTLTSAHTRNASTVSTETSRLNERNPFALHSLQLRFVRAAPLPMTNLVLQQLTEITTTGVPITHLYFVSLLDAQLDRAVLGKFMMKQFVPHNGHGVRDLEVCAFLFDVAAVQAFCTAIARSTCLRHVDFEVQDFVEDDDGVDPLAAEWWRWLAYALFSRHTDHAIRSVRIDSTSLTIADALSIREMLYHENPLALLYQATTDAVSGGAGYPTSQWPLRTASLHESAIAFPGHHNAMAGSMEEVDRPGIYLDKSVVPCQVVRDCADEDFVEVLLPGTGVCWLSRCDVVGMRPLVARDAHPIRELTINAGRFGGEAAQPLIELLQDIGGPLERLDLCHDEDLADNNFFRCVLASCVNLTHLELQWMRLESLDWLVEAPATCKLTTLEFCLVERLVEGSASWSRLFRALSEPLHPLTQKLRRLRISLRRRERGNAQDKAEEDVICQSFVAMLATNRLLQHCELVSCSQEASATYKTLFMAHHEEPLNEAEAPLPVAQKLAFLSVISAAQALPSPPKQRKKAPGGCLVSGSVVVTACANLTSELVVMVFGFAATPKRRVCVIDL